MLKNNTIYIDGGKQSFIDVDADGKQVGEATMGTSRCSCRCSEWTVLTHFCRSVPDHRRLDKAVGLENEYIDEGSPETWVDELPFGFPLCAFLTQLI